MIELPTESEPVRIVEGDCLSVMPRLPADAFDSVVSDPPYGLVEPRSGADRSASGSGQFFGPRDEEKKAKRRGGFMGKAWDAEVPGVPFWTEAKRVLKPGAYMLVMGGSRTYHRLACAVEDAGFEIRDCLMWIYGSGFPKAKSCLKPAYEPILLCRKPGKGMRELGIDECRIGTTVETWPASRGYSRHDTGSPIKGTQQTGDAPSGRWPANVLHDGSEEVMEAFAVFGESTGLRPDMIRHNKKETGEHGIYGRRKAIETPRYGDTAARFFYAAKASKSERGDGNSHPTVKPLALMEWLVKLVTPPNGLTLDPFAGSGTTGKASRNTGRRAVLIEREAAYADIARRRAKEAMGTGLLAGCA